MEDNTQNQNNQLDHDIQPANSHDEAGVDHGISPVLNARVIQQEEVMPHKKRKFGKKQITILAVILLLVGSGAGIFLFNKKDKNTVANSDPEKTNEIKSDATTPLLNITFSDTMKPIEKIDFIADYKFFGENCTGNNQTDCTNALDSNSFKYYQMGATKEGYKLIYVQGESTGIDQDNTFVLVQTNDASPKLTLLMQLSSYSYLLKNSDQSNYYSDFKKAIKSDVSIDEKTTFDEFKITKELKVAGQKLKTNSEIGYFIPDGITSIRGQYKDKVASSAIKKIGEDNGKTYYIVTAKSESTYDIKEFYAVYKNIYVIPYVQNGEVAGNSDKITFNWTAGEKNTSAYYSAGSGCGALNGLVIAKNVDKNSLVQVGTTAGKQIIYQLPTTHPLVKELHEKDYAKGEYIEDNSLKNLTVQQLTDKHGYILIENAFNEYVVFLRDDLFIRGGCAKPVIYLYPQKDISVDVSVGADVVKSDPYYPNGGWKNVLAKTDGSLTYKNQQFSSLFWDGYGHGTYPDIQSGTIVAKKDAVKIIRQQLIAQGLQGREIEDFVSYWEPKLPNKPYLRLTWFGNNQLNNLAPLTITPKPQTLIRVFLDFESLDKPISISPQKFKSPQRKGFTVVEWGGLARNGLSGY